MELADAVRKHRKAARPNTIGVAPHDEMVALGEKHTRTASWAMGTYSKSPLSKADRLQQEGYRFGNPQSVSLEAAGQHLPR